MALTRKMLKAMGIEDEQIDQIIEAHTETTDALKADRDKYKEETEKIPELEKQVKDLQKEKDSLQEQVEEGQSYKEKYDKEHAEFDDYKKGVAAKETKAKKAAAYKALLKKAGVSDKRIDAVMKVTSVDDLELDENGEPKDADKVVEKIKEEWSEFIVTETKKGAKTETPPKSEGGKKMTIEEIDAIEDTAERQKAMLENHELYGI